MSNDFKLGPPFAFVGLVAATLMLGFVGCSPQELSLWSLLPVFLYFIGRRQSRTGNYAATFGFLGLASWYIGAFLLAPHALRCGMCGHPLEIVFAGIVMGVFAYLPLVIPLCIFMTAAKRVRVARPGSVAARAEHRFVWAVGILPFAWLTGIVTFSCTVMDAPTWRCSLLLVASLGAQIAFFIADALTLRRLARGAALTATLPKLSVPLDHVTRIDLGVGDAIHGHVTAPGTYREAPQASLVLVGDPTRSAATVRACMRSYVHCLCALYAIPLVLLLILSAIPR